HLGRGAAGRDRGVSRARSRNGPSAVAGGGSRGGHDVAAQPRRGGRAVRGSRDDPARRTGEDGDRRPDDAGDRRTGEDGDRRTGEDGDRRTGEDGDRRTGEDGDRRPDDAGTTLRWSARRRGGPDES